MGCHSISEHVALKCAEAFPDFVSTQLCVLSGGMCVESVASRIILEERHRSRGRHLYFVVVPDRLPYYLMASFASSLGYFINKFNHEAVACFNRGVPDSEQSYNMKEQGEVGESLPVHVLREGTSTKDRCLTFQQSGVMVSTARMLCADLLHKRLSPVLVAAAVVCLPLSGFPAGESALASVAFCIEILLRGERSIHLFNHPTHRGSESTAGGKPRIVILSDSPATVRYLVCRHVVGREQFIQAMHVGDIQLFPCFRLSVLQHFEQLSRTKPLTLDRIVVSVPTSTRILDVLLQKVLREVLSELCKLQQRLQQGQTTPSSSKSGLNAHKRKSASLLLQDDLERFQPLVRLRLDPASPDGATCGREQHLAYDSSHASKYRNLANKAAEANRAHSSPDYTSMGAWRDVTDETHIDFSRISDEIYLDIQSTDVDADLQIALQSNTPGWPFRNLVESFLDLRKLRRRLWTCSQHDFFFALLSVMNRRRQNGSAYKQRLGQTMSAAPTASWTMSSSFNDIVTVATERIGRVVVSPAAAEAVKPHRAEPMPTVSESNPNKDNSNHHNPNNIGEDNNGNNNNNNDDDDDEVVIVEPKPSPALPSSSGGSSLAVSLIPNPADADTTLEVVYRLALSWVRGHRRRQHGGEQNYRQQRVLPDAKTTTTATAPAMLLVVFGHREVTRLVERFLYTREDFLNLQLSHFLLRYQAFYGVSLRREGTGPSADVDASSPSGLSDWVETVVVGEEPGESYNAEILDNSDEESVGEDAKGEANGEALTPPHGAGGEEDASPLGPLHSALLRQAGLSGISASQAFVECNSTSSPANTGYSSSVESWAAPFRLETARLGRVVLSPVAEDGQADNSSGRPRVVVADGSNLRAGELLALLRGESSFYYGTAVPPPSSYVPPPDGCRDPESCAAATDTLFSDAPIMVHRIVSSRQHIEFLRILEAVQDELEDDLLRALKVQLVTTTASEEESKATAEREKLAFKALAHAKATFTSIMLVDRASIRETEAILESGHLPTASRRQPAAYRASAPSRRGYQNAEASTGPNSPSAPLVLFDEREFRSMLPYFLYKQNIDLVPLTLVTADYVLSPEYALERKSIRDYTQSLQSGRIHRQLAALCRRYPRPLLLIEFHRHEPFRLVFTSLSQPASTELGYMRTLYTRTARLLMAYPQVSVLWSRSATHSAAMLMRLKKTVAQANMDPSGPSLTLAGDVGTNDEDEEFQSNELAVYAARVLAKFPGVTPANINRLMHLCGSLAGLATISQDALAGVIGETDGMKLYRFLHNTFAQVVD